MKYYQELVDLGCFTRKDLVKLTDKEETAKSMCRQYLKEGYIERVKHNLYVTMSLETHQPVSNRFVIASHIFPDAFVSYHSAFEFYGYSNQVFYEMQVTSKSRFRDFEYGGVTYKRVAPTIQNGVTRINGTRVTTIERTVIDSIDQFENIGGLEELLRCIDLIPSLNETALSTFLAEYNSAFLYQKTGYILSYFADSIGLSEDFFKLCKSHLPKGKFYLTKERQKGFVFHPEWRLYAPKNLRSLIDKGVDSTIPVCVSI